MQDEIRFIRKDPGSLTGGSAALYAAPGGGFFVQYKRVTDPAVIARLQSEGEANNCRLMDDEGFGYIPPGVITG
jgi:hypothetical protein